MMTRSEKRVLIRILKRKIESEASELVLEEYHQIISSSLNKKILLKKLLLLIDKIKK